MQKIDLPRTDVSAHDHAMELPIAEVVQELVDMLGGTTVAVIGGVKETRAVQEWLGERTPQRQHALRFALQLATMIAGTDDGEMARAWFHGSNPHLDDAVPMVLLHKKPLAEIQGPLLNAARAFANRE